MKIFLENINTNSSSGPNSFANKLLPQLSSMGHSFVPEHVSDISLCFIESPNYVISVPRVLRLDGIYFNTAQDWNSLNQNIRRTYDSSDGIIFQSMFCEKLIESYFGEHKRSTVIYNGADVDTILDTAPMVNEKYDNIWCCASSWRPHKRLEENIRYFREHKGNNDLLIVAGEVPAQDRVQDPSIVYFGNLSQVQLYSLYKSAKYFLHLAWLDHCPNVVVDARACGCHVICSSAGGTLEIAGPESTIIEEEEWDFKPTLLYEPPYMNFDKKVKNMFDPCYDMKEIAKEYSHFLEKTELE